MILGSGESSANKKKRVYLDSTIVVMYLYNKNYIARKVKPSESSN